VWLKQQCEELEQLQRIHDDFNLHRKIKETAGVYRKSPFSNVENDQRKLVQDDQQRKIKWENYISNLFADERPAVENVDDKVLSGPPITKEEIIRAINTSHDRKAIGPDRIFVELLIVSQFFQEIFIRIYDTGEFPAKWLTPHFIL